MYILGLISKKAKYYQVFISTGKNATYKILPKYSRQDQRIKTQIRLLSAAL